MIQALKEALWGHIGLLLNAPYKRDSMMGCGCGYISRSFFLVVFSNLVWLYEPGRYSRKKTIKGVYSGF
jgi:hypothetical protein